MLLRSKLAVLGVLATLSLGLGCGEPIEISSQSSAVHSVCGSSSTTPGIDVSKWQGTVDWNGVKLSGQKFALVRVSDGTSTPDVQFIANWSGSQSAGLIRGAYQYFRPKQDALAQADLLVDAIEAGGGLQSADLPPVLDLETNDGLATAAVLQKVDSWIERVKERTGRVPIIYTGSYFWDDNQFGSKHADYPLWTAHYTQKDCPLVPDPWTSWHFWQFTDSGSVQGIYGNVDMNRFNGDLPALQAFIATSHITPLAPDASVEPDTGTPPDAGVPPDLGPAPSAEKPVLHTVPLVTAPTSNDGRRLTDLRGGCSIDRAAVGFNEIAALLLLLLVSRRRYQRSNRRGVRP